MGDACTRNCGFCNIAHGLALTLDRNEPDNIAKAVQVLD